jgi:RNA polymerase sigma-70 factor, ECF subfamily
MRPSNDEQAMSAQPSTDHGAALLLIYDDALPQIYGYLRARCGSTSDAEELTSETFLAAVRSAKSGVVQEVSVPWLMGIARHKLMDHFRRNAREERNLRVIEDSTPLIEDPWDTHIDSTVALHVLSHLGLHHRSALTLRYLDGLAVREVATTLGRTVHATEALLVRARSAFRLAYGERSNDGI